VGLNFFDPHGHQGKDEENHTIQIWGTRGNMQLAGYDWAPHGVDMVTTDDGKSERFVPDPGEYVWQQGATVISKSMVDGTEPLINVEHALHVLEIIEAARASGQPVSG
jgi:predicted dehydrogenase